MELKCLSSNQALTTAKRTVPNQKVFAQGSSADAVFYIQNGKVKVTVVSEQGKEAVVAVLGPDEFCGEGCLTGQPLRLATATAMTDCEIMRLDKALMVRVLHEEPATQAMCVCVVPTIACPIILIGQ